LYWALVKDKQPKNWRIVQRLEHLHEYDYNKGKTAWKKFYDKVSRNQRIIHKPAMPIGDCCVYEGQWFEHGGKQFIQGKGKMVWPNGEIYEGWWQQGRRWGRGRNIYKNGDMYDGEFVDGEKEGFGVYSYHDGSRYEGHFAAGIPHGQGKDRGVEGDEYIGNY